MREKWRAVPGYEGFYEVSSLGRVRSVTRFVNHWAGERKVAGQILKPAKYVDADKRLPGYLFVGLNKNGVRKNGKVHRLVLTAFRGPRPKGKQARHLDGDIDNNELSNLQWATKLENEGDKVRHNTHVRGGRNGNARLTNAQARAIFRSTKMYKDLAAEYGVSRVTVRRIKQGLRYL